MEAGVGHTDSHPVARAPRRGRFDLELPRTRIPEARAISNALRTSALQLEDRVHRERDFAEHASHVLKTPLTGLRLELEDLTLRDDVPADVKETAARSLAAIDEVSNVAGELVELSRKGSLVAGAELPLVDLASQLAQRWADRLDPRTADAGCRWITFRPDRVLSIRWFPERILIDDEEHRAKLKLALALLDIDENDTVLADEGDDTDAPTFTSDDNDDESDDEPAPPTTDDTDPAKDDAGSERASPPPPPE